MPVPVGEDCCFTAKPELVCLVEVFRKSLLPVGRIDLAVEAPRYSDSGFALDGPPLEGIME